MSQIITPTQIAEIGGLYCHHYLADGKKIKRLVRGQALIRHNGLTGNDDDSETYADPDKALLHYAFDHYAHWRQRLPDARALLEKGGAFSENISTLGINERTLCIGDILSVGSAVIQVTQGREACNTMNQRFSRPTMNREMHDDHRNGWFYRVLEEGHMSAGDAVILRERSNPDWTIARVQQSLFNGESNVEILQRLSSLPYLAADWKALFTQRLEERMAD
jgi:MOSC domain-containing protein YiiM